MKQAPGFVHLGNPHHSYKPKKLFMHSVSIFFKPTSDSLDQCVWGPSKIKARIDHKNELHILRQPNPWTDIKASRVAFASPKHQLKSKTYLNATRLILSV